MVLAQCTWSEYWQLKPEALDSILGNYLDIFSSSKLSDVDGVMSSVVPYISTVWLLSSQEYVCVCL